MDEVDEVEDVGDVDDEGKAEGERCAEDSKT